MTITVALTTVTGTYKITVTGTAGGTTKTASITLKVTKAIPNFAVSASPTSFTVARGGIGTVTISTSISGGFNSAIALSASGEGYLQTLTFSPTSIAAPGAGTSTMTVTVGAKAVLGNHKITVKGTAGTMSRTTTVTLVVVD